MEIRRERAEDEAGVSLLATLAFAGANHSSRNEVHIVQDFQAGGSLTLLFVAADDDQLAGRAFSPILIAGFDLGWFGLAPVSVAPARRNEGSTRA